MRRVSSFLKVCLLVVVALTDAERVFQPGRRVCSVVGQSHLVSFLVSHMHPVYQPYLTVCRGQRLCSTYSTTYRVANRWAYRTISPLAYKCCPGWRRASGRTWLGCNSADCQPPCQNGGKCLFPNKCACPIGWTGRCCQTDISFSAVENILSGEAAGAVTLTFLAAVHRVGLLATVLAASSLKMFSATENETSGRKSFSSKHDVDECAGGRHGCSQACLNVAGSYTCGCQRGHKLQADGKRCWAPEAATEAPSATSPAGDATLTVEEDVTELRTRVLALEEKLQMVLAPFLKLEPPGLESASANPRSLFLHIWQQLDRIDSLSEQVSFLEERLETCTCQPELGGQRSGKRNPPF